MAKVRKTRLDDLPSHEKAEIEEILAEARRLKQPFGTGRFVSDEGDSMAFPLLLWIAAIGGIVAVFVNWSPATLVEEAGAFVTFLPRSIAGMPHLPGFLIAVIVAIWMPVHFLRVHGRHGWMLTSFGFVTIRGSKIRLLRWESVVKATRRRVRAPRNSFSVVTLETADGTTLESYAGALFETLKTKLPASAQIGES